MRKKIKQQLITHPCLDNTDGVLSLKIFRYMFTEPTIPREVKKNPDTPELNSDSVWVVNTLASHASSYDTSKDLRKIVAYKEAMANRAVLKHSRWQRLVDKLLRRKEVNTTMTEVKDVLVEETLSPKLAEAAAGIDKLIERAKSTSQVVLVEKLLEHKKVLAGQQLLAQHGFDKYVSEGTIIKFIKRSMKGVRLDFIRNYTQLIPLSVLELKAKADELEVFDNYCVLYYDSAWESWGEQASRITVDTTQYTDEKSTIQRARERDPILFGMIHGSRKLYYIGDWITDDDDLTLAQLNLVVENATEYLRYYNLDQKERVDANMQELIEQMTSLEQWSRVDQ